MAGWPIRRKLIALVAVPMIVMLSIAAVVGVETVLNYRSSRQARALAGLSVDVVQLNQSLRAERNSSLALLAADDSDRTSLTTDRGSTDDGLSALKTALAHPPTGGWTSRVSDATSQVDQAFDGLGAARASVVANSQRSPQAVLDPYDRMTQALATLMNATAADLGAATHDNSTSDGAATTAATFRIASDAGVERDLINIALSQHRISNDDYQQLLIQGLSQTNQYSVAALYATQAQASALQAAENASDGPMTRFRSDMQKLVSDSATVAVLPFQPAAFRSQVNSRVKACDQIADVVVTRTEISAISDERTAWIRAGLVIALIVLACVIVATVLASIARTVTLPLRRLRLGAVDVANVQLPAAVARIEREGVDAVVGLTPVLPPDAPVGPETLEVARAVDDLGAEAVRLATAQVRLRRALDEAFVSMSRRSQSMVEKQLAIIDELESQEQDPDQLRNLFRLDHLAARMRRYNDNLLVLAGSAVRTRATAPIKVAELFRAATSEMEQYERVRLQPVSGASVTGTVAGELVHLLAELLDNAAMYSPPSSPIVLSAAFTADGGLQIEVLDSGVGISPGELDRLNARLTQPESIDTQVPSRMGLFVVARLAHRGGFSTMLQARPDATGTVALVRVPPQLVIGAPGSSGQTPRVVGPTQRSLTPVRGFPFPATGRDAYAPPRGSAGLDLPAPASPPGRAVPAQSAPAAAAGPRPVSEPGGGRTALPRRQRPAQPQSSPGGLGAPLLPGAPGALPGVPAASGTGGPASLFTPGPGPNPADDELGRPARQQPAGQQPAGQSGRAGAERPQPAPSDTSPSGIPAMDRPLVSPATGAIDVNQVDRLPGNGLERWAGGRPAFGAGARPHAAAPSNRVGDDGVQGGAPAAGALQGRPAGGDRLDDTLDGQVHDQPELDPLAARFDTGPAGLPVRKPRVTSAGTSAEQLLNGTGEIKSTANPEPPTGPDTLGTAPAAWDDGLPAELAARAAPAYVPSELDGPMIGNPSAAVDDPNPIFDQISVWFTAEPTGSSPRVAEPDASTDSVIDLRERQPAPSSRWADLGDQRWLATNARASAAPDTAGTTDNGLPLRRPGANLLPSAATAAPQPRTGPAHRVLDSRTGADPRTGAGSADALGEPAVSSGADESSAAGRDPATVRGRLGSYQQGLTTARRARGVDGEPSAPAFDPVGARLFAAHREPGDDESTGQGGDE